VNPASEFCGPNAAYVLELYDRFLREPASVDERSRAFFEKHAVAYGRAPGRLAKTAAALAYVHALRTYGHLSARLDPLGLRARGDAELDPATYGLQEEDLRALPSSLADLPDSGDAETLLDAVETLHSIYCSTTGYDYAHIHDPAGRAWLRRSAEERRFRPPRDPIDAEALLDRLTQVEVYERFLHGVFPGRTRFSLEGLDMLVPMLDELIAQAAEDGTRHVLIGTSHRGRLNLLAHVLGLGYGPVLADFEHDVRAKAFRDDMSWSGDVTYHQGARHAVEGGDPVRMLVTLPPNPSHVELVDPVVLGMARAAGTRTDEPGAPEFDPSRTLPVLVHGDAALAGQGVAAEAFNLAGLDGYTTGGTVHIVVNNRIGYTTTPREGRSTGYASDVATGFKVPVLHVNADDPVACLEAVRTAFAFRRRFHRDFLVDLVGYRRHGHNEGDEPAFTQPRLYARIREHRTVRAQWAERIGAGDAEKRTRACRKELRKTLDELEGESEGEERDEAGDAPALDTKVPLKRLRALNAAMMEDPEGFHLHPKVSKARARRRDVLAEPDEPAVDWPTAEDLALASILADGIAVRLTGEDAARGTFSQRHAVLHDVETGASFAPLQHLPLAKAPFEVRNSPLTENAALGFEYGYNVQAPDRLVLWEAQYGDFVNGAQATIDEFLVSGRAKWRQTPSLVLLLPHGYEGQGPDHSSARPERFLSLAAGGNLRLANCTTAAQYFHLLRRHAGLLATDPAVLVVLTPKGLLRHRRTKSTPRELADGAWRPVLDDDRVEAEDVRRLVLCSGKVHVDLVESDHADDSAVAVCRVEQLYPFPAEELRDVVGRYEEVEEVVWAQEEPRNMGAWPFARPFLTELCGDLPLTYVGRARSASPAEGAAAWHEVNQASIVEMAFDPGAEPAAGGMVEAWTA